MPRAEKVDAVARIKARLSESQAVFLTEYRGLTVSQQQELRRRLRDAAVEYAVVKMTLARLAADDLGLDDLDPWLAGPTALAFADGDPVAAAKTLRDFAGEHNQLVLKAGILSGLVIAPEQVAKLADIEPRETLLARIAFSGKAPLARLAGLLAAFTRDAAWMFRQFLELKEAATVTGERGKEKAPGPEPAPGPEAEGQGEAAEDAAAEAATESAQQGPPEHQEEE